MIRIVRAALLLLLPVVVASALHVPSAHADTIRLRSGAELAVGEVRILERSVRLSLLDTGGLATVELRFRDLDPVAFLGSAHAPALTPLQRLRFEVLARLARQVEATAKARKAKAAAPAPKPVPPAPAPPPRPPRRRADPTPPPREDPTGNVPPRGSYAEERYRERVPSRPAPPPVPGRSRPPMRDGGGNTPVPTR